MPVDRNEARQRWSRTCGWLVVPYAAILHHAVFYPGTCVLNPFEGAVQQSTNLKRLLREDASIPWALVGAIATYRAGEKRPAVRRLCAPLPLSTLPLSVWLWDIPFSGRALCARFHDGKANVRGIPVRTAHVYGLSAGLYVASLALGVLRGRR